MNYNRSEGLVPGQFTITQESMLLNQESGAYQQSATYYLTQDKRNIIDSNQNATA